MEKRRRRPSYIIPVLFFLLEIVMMWLTISLINWEFNIQLWNTYSYPAGLLWIAFSISKLIIVLKRQKNPHE